MAATVDRGPPGESPSASSVEPLPADERLRLLEGVAACANDALVITEASPLDSPGPRIVYVNRAFTSLTGYDADEILGRNPRFLQGPDTDRAATARIRQALETGEPARVELLDHRKDGTPFRTETDAVPMRDNEGRITHWAFIQRHASARRGAEDTGRRLEREEAAHAEAATGRSLSESIVDSIGDPFFALDRDWRLTYVNRRAAEVVQMEPEGLRGQNVWEAVPALVGSEIEGAMRAGMEDREAVRIETCWRPTGLWFEACVYPAADGISVYLRDITDRRAAEAALRASEAKFSGILSIAADAIVSMGEDQRITLFNRGAEEIFGYAADEVMGKPLDLLLPEAVRDVHHRHARDFARSRVRARRMGERGRVSGRRKNGEVFPADASISQVEILGQRVYTAVLRDITAAVHAEEALAQANEQLRTVFRASPLAIIAVDLEGRVQIWNSAAEKIFGWTEEEVIGQAPPIIPDDYRSELESEREAAERADATGFASERLRKDGTRVVVSAWTAPIADPTGQPRGMIFLLEDVTERRRGEEEQRRLAAIVEATTDIVSTADLEGNILYLNRAGREILGDDLTGSPLTRHLPVAAAGSLLRQAIPTAMRYGFWAGESAILDRAGNAVPVSQVLIAHKDAHGEVEYLSTVIRDISERNAVEDRQRFLAEASRALTGSLDYEDVLARMLQLIVPRLADYCVIDMGPGEGEECARRRALLHRDPAKEDLLQALRAFPPRAAPGFGPSGVLYTEEPELVQDVTAAWLRAVTETDEQKDEEHLRILQALGARSELIVPLQARNRTVGVLTCVYTSSGRRYTPEDVPLLQDIGGRGALALDNAELYRQAQDALNMRDQVLSIVAHDLRNPLQTIGYAAQILADEAGPRPQERTDVAEHDLEQEPQREEERSCAELIQRSVGRANRLIDDLLDVARMQAGTLTVRPQPEQPEAIAAEALELHRPFAAQKHVQMEHQAPQGLPKISADRDRLLQVLSNLLGNAIKFTPEGGHIALSTERVNGSTRFRVSDDGPGISSEDLSHVFEPFWQVHGGERLGAGLGLAIAKGIVEAHGGEMSVRSGPGEGTTIEFTIPLAGPDAS